jgi:dTDP-4-amino-4,6-dideoxygalactose transaminase
MRVPLLDLSEQYRSLAEPIRQRMDEIFSTQRFILGPNVERFEKAVAAFIGTPHAIGISSGTDALMVVYMALNLGPDDAIVTSPYSFFATAGCVARTRARPLFVDIDPTTYNLSPQALAAFLEKECEKRDAKIFHRGTGKVIRAIVPVHLFGLCCDMQPIVALAEQYDLPLIEDAAQAIGAEYPFGPKTKQAGTMSDYACFSFYPSKNLGAAGDAGLVVTGDEKRAQQIKILRQHGMEPRYFHHVVGGNFRLDEIQAAILDVKLPFLRGWSEARRKAATYYTNEFHKAGLTERITPPAEPYRGKVESHHIYHQYIIRTEKRDALAEHLHRDNIGTAIYYPLGLHLQKAFQYLGHGRGDFPETERAADETLALPIYPEISREAQSYVVESIGRFFR